MPTEACWKISFSVRIPGQPGKIKKAFCRITKPLIPISQTAIVTTEKYQLVKKTWLEKSWQSLSDILIYYNVLDCTPLVQAVENLLIPYKQQHFNIFKRVFLVSGVAK